MWSPWRPKLLGQLIFHYSKGTFTIVQIVRGPGTDSLQFDTVTINMECRQLERYSLSGLELEETGKVLGRGSYGEVVEMKLSDGRIVAGKKIHDTFFDQDNASGQDKPTKERFEQECERYAICNNCYFTMYYHGTSCFINNYINNNKIL